MTKAQAANLTAQLDGRLMPYSIVMALDNANVPFWTVQLDPKHTYAGVDLGALQAYCVANGLQLTAIFNQLGVV